MDTEIQEYRTEFKVMNGFGNLFYNIPHSIRNFQEAIRYLITQY